MSIAAKPPAEVAIDEPLVRALLLEQHPDLADLTLMEVGEGWDNRLFRLGDDLAVRLPRRAASAALIEQEQRWLPSFAPTLPLPIPRPHRIGRPTDRFPWCWSVVPWFHGESALLTPPNDYEMAAGTLGSFLRAFHRPAPEDAPHNPWRQSLASRTPLMTERLQQVEGLVDRVAVVELWNRVLDVPVWPGPRLWIHGDLHPRNLLVSEGRLSAVLDFGDLTAGDPAIDLSVAWMLLPPLLRPALRNAARNEFSPVDDDTWMRARGWALTLGLMYVAFSSGDDALRTLGLATMGAALDEDG